MNFVEFLKKHRIFLSIVILIIFIPIPAIHILFSIHPDNQWWVAKWSAGELLDYFGSLMGAIATIIAVAITIRYTKLSQDEQNILQVKPYLQTKYTSLFSYQELYDNANNRIIISMSDELIESAYEKTWILNSIEKNEIDNTVFFQHYHILKYTLRNVGANSATNIRWTSNDMQLIPEFALSKDETREFIIIIDSNILKDDIKELNFKFIYDDVLSIATYSQKENITITSSSNELYSVQMNGDYLSTPKRI